MICGFVILNKVLRFSSGHALTNSSRFNNCGVTVNTIMFLPDLFVVILQSLILNLHGLLHVLFHTAWIWKVFLTFLACEE